MRSPVSSGIDPSTMSKNISVFISTVELASSFFQIEPHLRGLKAAIVSPLSFSSLLLGNQLFL